MKSMRQESSVATVYATVFILVICSIFTILPWLAIDEASFVNLVYGHTNPPPGYTILSNGALFTYIKGSDNSMVDPYRRYECKHKAIRMAWHDLEARVEEAKQNNTNWTEINK